MPPENAHILVIDDNEDLLFMLKAMLGLKGYKISVKENIDDLEAYIEKLSPDLILMDMLLSGADGREVCKQLKANPAFAPIPVIMISAHADAKKECLDAGANFFLDKPFEMEDLLETVSTALIRYKKISL